MKRNNFLKVKKETKNERTRVSMFDLRDVSGRVVGTVETVGEGIVGTVDTAGIFKTIGRASEQ